MRKMIMMAVAGFIWRKMRSRFGSRAATGRSLHRTRY